MLAAARVSLFGRYCGVGVFIHPVTNWTGAAVGKRRFQFMSFYMIVQYIATDSISADMKINSI